MELTGVRAGFAVTGSFCTLNQVMKVLPELKEQGLDLYPIMSEKTAVTDTRFGEAKEIKAYLETVCGKPVMTSVKEAEPIGPKNLLDILIVAPCTGNTLSKIANGITDTSVTMAAKANLRNEHPLVLAVATNDGLSGSAKNIGALFNTKHVFFVPFGQDDPNQKPTSLVSDMSEILPTVRLALDGKQIQPILREKS